MGLTTLPRARVQPRSVIPSSNHTMNGHLARLLASHVASANQLAVSSTSNPMGLKAALLTSVGPPGGVITNMGLWASHHPHHLGQRPVTPFALTSCMSTSSSPSPPPPPGKAAGAGRCSLAHRDVVLCLSCTASCTCERPAMYGRHHHPARRR